MMRRLRRRRPEIPQESDALRESAADSSPEVTAEDSAESEDGTEPTSPEVTAEDSAEGEAEEGSTEVEDAAEAGDAGDGRRPSRLGRGWLAGIAAALLLFAGAIGAGGYLALHYHQQSQAIARNNAAAIKAAIDCVSATQAPDTNALVASEQKILECGTDAFHAQAVLYTSMLVQAYQAANVHVQVSDVRAAVERNNPDGTVDLLVALRVKVASDQSQNETGYRLRVRMAYAEGQYKIAKLDQVTK
jgi:Mce-associated membrane protein